MAEKIIGQRMTVSLLGSGYAAIHMVLVRDESGDYWDVQQTGCGRYKTAEEAGVEARQWSESDGIPMWKDAT